MEQGEDILKHHSKEGFRKEGKVNMQWDEELVMLIWFDHSDSPLLLNFILSLQPQYEHIRNRFHGFYRQNFKK